MIDTHCHLTFPDFAGRERETLAAARDAGVTGVITICTTSGGVGEVLALAHAHDHVWCSAGVHPLYVDRDARDWPTLRRAIADPRCVAWGELGLDRHHDRPPLALQRDVLIEQIALIEACRDERIDKPVVIHCRKAVGDLLPLLRTSTIPGDRFVFHCFTEPPEDAAAVLDFGAMLSFTGVVTYPNAPEVRASAALAPLDRIMVETDAPFLAPQPVRGRRRCEPAFAAYTAAELARIKGVDLARFAGAVDDNAARFFGVRAPAPAPGVLGA